MNRRRCLKTVGAALLAGGATPGMGQTPGRPRRDPIPLQLDDYQPKSMLHVPETPVLRSKFPVIDVHSHLSGPTREFNGEGIAFRAKPEDLLPVMDRKNLRMMVNLRSLKCLRSPLAARV